MLQKLHKEKCFTDPQSQMKDILQPHLALLSLEINKADEIDSSRELNQAKACVKAALL